MTSFTSDSTERSSIAFQQLKLPAPDPARSVAGFGALRQPIDELSTGAVKVFLQRRTWTPELQHDPALELHGVQVASDSGLIENTIACLEGSARLSHRPL